jgi:hypothetical protein
MRPNRLDLTPTGVSVAKYVLHVGSHTAQGVRPTTKTGSWSIDQQRIPGSRRHGRPGTRRASQRFGRGDHPKVVQDRLAAQDDTTQAMRKAFTEAPGNCPRRQGHAHDGMGTTAVLAVEHQNQVYVAGLGDSRAYLVRDGGVSS